MKKYLQILKTSFQQEFAYKLSFVMWRVRNVIQILVFFFLWGSVFKQNSGEILGYSQSDIFTYAFALIIVRAIVLSSRSVDVSGIVARGDLMNLLLKPINFFKYWATRDLGSKLLNLSFGIFEVLLLVLILKPDIFIQTSPIYFLSFLLAILIANFLFFTLLMVVNFAPFWMPEISWGAQFLFMIIFVEFLSGSFFPLDVFPQGVFDFIMYTPFPYLVFVPIKIYLGSFSMVQTFKFLAVGMLWCVLSYRLMLRVWNKGLLIYEGVGK